MSKMNGQDSHSNFNIGKWVSAKIYSDMKNGCQCGNSTWARKKIKQLPEFDEPVCSKCGGPPDVYVIAASIEDEDGRTGRLKVRHDQDGNRLKDIFSVVHTLKTVNSEMKTQTFDIGKYLSRESRESYRFDKVVELYKAHHEKRLKRGEISPAGLKDKLTIIKNHLHVFNEIDIGHISAKRIRTFFNDYTENLRMRDKATSELKTIFYFALAEGKLHKMPDFPEISSAKMVSSDNFLDEKKQNLVISKIENPLYRAVIKVLAIYGLRPCDVRSLKWADINYQEMVFHVRSHISLSKDIPGRKSQADAVHSLPITEEFHEILQSLPRSIRLDDYIFKGAKGGPIGANVLTRAWNEACKIAKVKGVKMYWGTKHSTLSNLSKKASDAQLIKLTGHTNTKIIRRYAQSNIEELRIMLN